MLTPQNSQFTTEKHFGVNPFMIIFVFEMLQYDWIPRWAHIWTNNYQIPRCFWAPVENQFLWKRQPHCFHYEIIRSFQIQYKSFFGISNFWNEDISFLLAKFSGYYQSIILIPLECFWQTPIVHAEKGQFKFGFRLNSLYEPSINESGGFSRTISSGKRNWYHFYPKFL